MIPSQVVEDSGLEPRFDSQCTPFNGSVTMCRIVSRPIPRVFQGQATASPNPYAPLSTDSNEPNASLFLTESLRVHDLQPPSAPPPRFSFRSSADCGASLVAQMVKNLPARQETRFDPCVRKILYAVGSIGAGAGRGENTTNCRSRKLQGVKPLSPWSPFSFKNTTPSPFFDDLNLSQGPF